MAGRIADADVALVRERAAIDRIVGEHLQLRQAGGGNLKGLCPFHDEKSPSFQVSPAKGFFHCFGCGEGGDVITFVRKVELLSFTEAVEHLAAQVGVQLHYEGGGAGLRQDGRGLRQRLVAAHVEAQAFYAEQLVRSADAEVGRAFLRERGFDAAAAERFGVGFAPAGWDALTEHLSSKGFSRDELATSGLASDSRRGTLIDRFRGRLVWPIRELSGDLVGFGARRLLPDDQGPKYLNTPETALYKKSRVLYGVDLAKTEIAKRRQAVVVEGYTDVMACHLAGVPTAVATCGTAFGEEHVTVLRRLLLDNDDTGEVIFTFDGDSAGQKAALKAGALDARFSASTFVAVAAGGQDPCELRLSGGDAAVVGLVRARVPLFDFVVRAEAARHDLDTGEGRTAALAAITPVLRGIKDEGLRLEYVVTAARILGFEDAEPVRARVIDRPAARGRAPAQRAATDRAAADRTAYVERELLKAVLQQPAQVGPPFDELEADAFSHPVPQAVHATVIAAGGVAAGAALAPAAWVARVREAAADDAIRSQVTALAVEPLLSAESDIARLRHVTTLVPRVREFALGRQLTELKGRLQRSPDDMELFTQVLSLETRRRRLSEQCIGAL